jgi:sulfite exporter TauE/SafE
VLSSGGNPALATVPPLLRVVFALPYLVALFAFGTVAGAVSGWRQGYWSLAGRVHQTILAVIAVVFAWQLLVLGFLP